MIVLFCAFHVSMLSKNYIIGWIDQMWLFLQDELEIGGKL